MTEEASSLFDGDEFERETVRRALDGDRAAALTAIGLCIDGLAARRLSPILSDYLWLALDRATRDPGAINGAAWETSFNLRRQKNRRADPERTLGRDIDIAVWIDLAVKRGMPLADAKESARAFFGVENIDRALRRVGPVLEVNEAFYEESFRNKGRPLPSRR